MPMPGVNLATVSVRFLIAFAKTEGDVRDEIRGLEKDRDAGRMKRPR